MEHYEYRLEFWDGDTETAWKVCEPTSIEHEEPSRLLVQMATRFEILSLQAEAVDVGELLDGVTEPGSRTLVR